jgi:ApaG protein
VWFVTFRNRHWIFKSENSETEVPKFAPGVIGLNPTIHPGKIFQYMSMAHLESDHGTMEGSFLLQDMGSGEPFEAKVGVCKLSANVFVTS